MTDKPATSARNHDSQQPTVLLLCTDLFFGVQLQNMARKAGVRPVPSRPGQPLPPADLMVVDLAARADVANAIRQAVATGVPVVAFGPHMDTEARRAAKEAGASRVLTNSNLARDLPPILSALRSAEEDGGEDGGAPRAGQ
jgi:hypothetical protein